MEIDLLTPPALQTPLLRLKRWISTQVSRQQHDGYNPTIRDGRPAPTQTMQSLHGGRTNHHRADDTTPSAQLQIPGGTPGSRPLRGNWPFTVQPPLHAPELPVQPPAPACRSLLAATTGNNINCHVFLTPQATDATAQCAIRTLRKTSGVGAGRLVIAGRMAEVCAELDRLAAFEAIQTQSHLTIAHSSLRHR